MTITRDSRGRYVVADDKRTYGAYRKRFMAEYRLCQVQNSRYPCKKKGK